MNLPKAEAQVLEGMTLGQWHGFKGVTIPAWKDAAFNTAQQKLVPIIWNHGFFSSNGAYQATMMELASHGHLCISMNDKTGNSCCFTENPDGTPVEFDMKAFKGDEDQMIADGKSDEVFDRFQEVLNPRVEQVIALIDELDAGEFVKKHLDSDIPVDMDRLCVGGHSFGGTTTCKSALQDKRIKGCLTFDPYMVFAKPESNIEKDFNLGETAFQAIETSNWKDMMNTDLFNYRERFIRVNTKGQNQEWTTFNTHGHAHCADHSLVNPELVQLNDSCNPLPCSGRVLA